MARAPQEGLSGAPLEEVLIEMAYAELARQKREHTSPGLVSTDRRPAMTIPEGGNLRKEPSPTLDGSRLE